MKRIKDSNFDLDEYSCVFESDLMEEPVLLGGEPYCVLDKADADLWISRIKFENTDDDIVVGECNIIENYYFDDDEDEFNEPDTVNILQGFKIYADVLDSMLHSKYKGDNFINFNEDYHSLIIFDNNEYDYDVTVALSEAIIAYFLQHKNGNISDSRRRVRDDNFKPHGARSITNTMGSEIEIDPYGEKARFRYSTIDGDRQDISRWCQIQTDRDGRNYCKTKWGKEYLDEYMRGF